MISDESQLGFKRKQLMESQQVQQVWVEYGSQLRLFLKRRVSNSEDAEDLFQEIFSKTHQHMKTIEDSDKIVAWVFQVARNILTDYYRKNSASAHHVDISEFEEVLENPKSAEPSVHLELSQCLQPFLKQLPEKYREAVDAVDLKGISQKELAETLGLSHSAVKSRVQRGRQMLGELFRECCSFEVDVRGNVMDFERKSDCC